ncbi:hypothetical protein BDV25DRAFT_144140 [Aspergillus avenaceus]|uniref:Uncharacterized protein n=1 Tax=Aspergillus avenaceus TaxID=36643 RepID=A0A5N6TIQ0_ASPAV|nr:hypothetical protein BDV25DRAFT_144140 [Aspergillus avenaceus]
MDELTYIFTGLFIIFALLLLSPNHLITNNNISNADTADTTTNDPTTANDHQKQIGYRLIEHDYIAVRNSFTEHNLTSLRDPDCIFPVYFWSHDKYKERIWEQFIISCRANVEIVQRYPTLLDHFPITYAETPYYGAPGVFMIRLRRFPGMQERHAWDQLQRALRDEPLLSEMRRWIRPGPGGDWYCPPFEDPLPIRGRSATV